MSSWQVESMCSMLVLRELTVSHTCRMSMSGAVCPSFFHQCRCFSARLGWISGFAFLVACHTSRSICARRWKLTGRPVWASSCWTLCSTCFAISL